MLVLHRSLRSIARLALLAYAAGCDSSAVVPTSANVVSTDSAQARIAFVSGRGGNNEIYTMNADGSGVTRLTDNPASDLDPAWSPDGSRILFESSRDGNYELYAMNADGSGVTRLTTDSSRDRYPARCGSRIAFSSDRYRPPYIEIYVMNDDGTGLTRLTNNDAFSEYPAWSPSCDRIAYSFDPYGTWVKVRVMNADGSNDHELVGPPLGKSRHPAWSPDGTRIAFANDRDASLYYEIYVMNADGTQQTRLTQTRHTVNGPIGGYDFPTWSPDGTQMAFQSWEARGIYVMNADGSGLKQVADSVPDARIAWFGPGASPPPPPPVPPPPPPHKKIHPGKPGACGQPSARCRSRSPM